ncbi:MAG: hypothetical protein HY561_00555 [Gemmatimonadetes bacterium]|nr:hypothetical protein [Gemmatimonadota bacterium]
MTRSAQPGRAARAARGTLVLLAVACGDVATSDTRGYTKATLEDPGLTIRAERSTAMDALGDPILPLAAELQPEAN